MVRGPVRFEKAAAARVPGRRAWWRPGISAAQALPSAAVSARKAVQTLNETKPGGRSGWPQSNRTLLCGCVGQVAAERRLACVLLAEAINDRRLKTNAASRQGCCLPGRQLDMLDEATATPSNLTILATSGASVTAKTVGVAAAVTSTTTGRDQLADFDKHHRPGALVAKHERRACRASTG